MENPKPKGLAHPQHISRFLLKKKKARPPNICYGGSRDDSLWTSLPHRAAAIGTNSLAVHFRTMNTAVGLFAAVCTTLSYFPQLKKCWETGSAGDLSLKMFLTLALGVATWIVYGFLQRDFVIILANAVSLCLLLGILYFKLREHRRG